MTSTFFAGKSKSIVQTQELAVMQHNGNNTTAPEEEGYLEAMAKVNASDSYEEVSTSPMVSENAEIDNMRTKRLQTLKDVVRQARIRKSAAANHVFRVPELLELILAHLPFTDLIKLQRLDTGWRDVITTSPTIQEQIFRRPLHIKEEQLEEGEILVPDWNPITCLGTQILKGPSTWYEEDYRVVDEKSQHYLKQQKNSLHSMFLTQPPEKELEIHAEWVYDGGTNTGKIHESAPTTIMNPSGLTFEDLAIAINEPNLEWKPSSYWQGRSERGLIAGKTIGYRRILSICPKNRWEWIRDNVSLQERMRGTGGWNIVFGKVSFQMML